MNHNATLSEKLLDCDGVSTDPDSLIKEIQDMIAHEHQRQAKWHRLMRNCLVALGGLALVMVGAMLFLPTEGVHTTCRGSRESAPTRPVASSPRAAGELADVQAKAKTGNRAAGSKTTFRFGVVDTIVMFFFVVASFLVLAVLVSMAMRWAASRSVGNAVIQQQLLELAQQVEQLQERPQG